MLPSELLAKVAEKANEVEKVDRVYTYEPVPSGVATPSVFVDLEAVRQLRPSTADNWHAEATIRVVVAIPHNVARASEATSAESQVTAWDLGYAVAQHLRSQRWDLDAEPCRLTGLQRGAYGDLDADFDTVEIELTQVVYLDSLNPAGSGLWYTDPSAAWAGRSPETGVENLDKYEKVSEWPST